MWLKLDQILPPYTFIGIRLDRSSAIFMFLFFLDLSYCWDIIYFFKNIEFLQYTVEEIVEQYAELVPRS